MKKVREDQRQRHVPMMPRKMMLAGLLASFVVVALLIVPQYMVP